MRVKAIMKMKDELTCISLDDTIATAMELIDQNHLLSLPVVEGKNFAGILSKQFTYEKYFKEFKGTKEEFLALPVRDFVSLHIDTITDDMRIEEAAALFIDSKLRFIPVVDEWGFFEGIVTQQAVFVQYQKLFGHAHNSFTIYTYDYKGVIAKITELITKNGGNIRNMMMFNTEVMGLAEIFFRVDAKDIDKILNALSKAGFKIKDIKKVTSVATGEQ